MYNLNAMDNVMETSIKFNDFWFAFGTFIDGFKRSSSNEKAQLLSQAPNYNKYIAIPKDNTSEPNLTLTYEQQMAYLAATVHKLSNDYDLPTPEWVFDSKFKLKEPRFFLNTNNVKYQEFLKQTSPIEFRQRNLFVSDNILSRA